jgi:hypothetical protein
MRTLIRYKQTAPNDKTNYYSALTCDFCATPQFFLAEENSVFGLIPSLVFSVGIWADWWEWNRPCFCYSFSAQIESALWILITGELLTALLKSLDSLVLTSLRNTRSPYLSRKKIDAAHRAYLLTMRFFIRWFRAVEFLDSQDSLCNSCFETKFDFWRVLEPFIRF